MHARGAVTVFMDADMAADPRDIRLLVRGLERADVAIGSRAVPGAVVENVPRTRVQMGRMFNRFLRPVTGLSVLDTQCGFKAFRTSSAKLLFALSNVDGFAFDVEILVLAQRIGLSVREVPVHWCHQAGSHVSPLQDSMTMLSDVVRLRRGRWSKPIPAVAVEPQGKGGHASPATCALAGNVRSTDAVFGSGRRALVLLPFVSPIGVASVADRLRHRLDDFIVCPTVIRLEDLIDLVPIQRHAHDRVVAVRPLTGLGEAVRWSGVHPL
jgi:glycosyl transferase family 2